MKYYVVDAFADEVFHGNQAGVCVTDAPLETGIMQKIAAENNLSETAFVVKNGTHYDLRWFTPAVEIELCGHATLGTAFVLSSLYDAAAPSFEFHTLSGVLKVSKTRHPVAGELLEMDFPVRPLIEIAATEAMSAAVNAPVRAAWGGYNLMLELENENTVKNLEPDIAAIKNLREYHGVIVTAKGESCDFVSRFFAPNVGINEDPVTGSSHTTLIPLWSKRLGKTEMTARQLSKRGGTLYCKNAGERVLIAGKACLYMAGEIHVIPDSK